GGLGGDAAQRRRGTNTRNFGDLGGGRLIGARIPAAKGQERPVHRVNEQHDHEHGNDYGKQAGQQEAPHRYTTTLGGLALLETARPILWILRPAAIATALRRIAATLHRVAAHLAAGRNRGQPSDRIDGVAGRWGIALPA